MLYQDIAKKIVASTIRNAIYIDDKIVLPFEESSDSTLKGVCKKLYESFNTNNSTLDFYRFDAKNDWREKKDLFFKGKDLVIIDWHLDELKHNSYQHENTLPIISEAVKTDSLHFVCIYTQTPEQDFDGILYALKAYFCELSADGQILIDEFFSNIEEAGIDTDKLKTELKTQLRTLALKKDDEKGKFLSQIDFFLKNEFQSIFSLSAFQKKIKEIFQTGDLICAYQKLGYLLNEEILSLEKQKNSISVQFLSNSYIRINHTIILVVNKKGLMPENDIFGKFSEAIIGTSGNFLTMMGLEMRNLFVESSAFLGKDIDSINENAFFHHYDKCEHKSDFFDFLKQLWKEQSFAYLNNHTNELKLANETTLSEYRKNQSDNPIVLPNELAKLNYYYNIVEIPITESRKISFGDIFQGNNKSSYYLCVTAHCDCNTSENINHQFHFIKGEKDNLLKLTQEGDAGYNSFIKGEKKDIIAIKWQNKPFTIFIPKDINNTAKSINVQIQNKDATLSYCCSIKENYAQRMTNWAFANPLRVGIFFVDNKLQK
jgi:hypothetical protein